MKKDDQLLTLFRTAYLYKLDNVLQRPYEWEADRVVKLINDIVNSTKIKGSAFSRYNVGDFITYSPNNELTVKYLFDGQQRMTTLMLLFANILHHNPSPTVVTSIHQILYASVWVGVKSETVKRLQLRNEDDIVFSMVIAGGPDHIDKKYKQSFIVRNYNLISKEFTNGMSRGELDALYESIVSGASYFERECESRLEGIRQFNNLNGGQQSLKESRKGISALYAIYNESGQHNDRAEEILCELSNQTDIKARQFFSLFIYYKCGRYKENGFSDALDRLMRSKVDVVNEIIKFRDGIYKAILENAEGNPFLELGGIRQFYIDLFTDKNSWSGMVSESEKKLAYLKMEWGYISYILQCNGRHATSSLSADIMESYSIEKGSLSQYVTSKLVDKGCFMNPMELKTLTLEKNGKIATKILLRINEVFSRELGVKEPIHHIDAVTLEHIYPQRPKKNLVYNCTNEKTNTLGNLSLIGKSGNTSNSNKLFKDKIELYRISPYLINSQHLCNYGDWNDKTIDDNADWYIARIRNLYKLV